ncbi:CoA transferase subunit A [Geobacter grbiciae]|uniref:CoA transferase subunit A n=1 Tax=Geobacter grbiciae TaxID=155042 RepID=UPI001C01EF5D|nr:CoA transferase [Geobacter grbiciae]MBT1074336.1 acyl CoA--acetate/3-ketoacid CoA transferase subunit alpha [Geobacter grbiciae]
MGTGKRITLQQAAEIIKDGSSLTFSGFTIWRRPMAIVFELIRQQRRGLHLIEVNGGPHTEFLVGAGCVDIWESCWVGHELYGKYGANLSRKVGNREIIVEDYSHAEMMFRFAAGAAGAPYAVTQTSLGTDIHNPEYDMLGRAGRRDGKRIPKQKYVFTEDPFYEAGSQVLVPAAKADIAIMCVQQVGEEGTVRVSGQYYSDPEAARTADITIVMAEEIVPEEYLRREADRNTITSFEVDHILECPFGAHPTGMFGRYDVDGAFLKDFYSRTRTQEGFNDFEKEWITGLDHMGYLEKLGWPRMLNLKANTALNYSTSVKRGQ